MSSETVFLIITSDHIDRSVEITIHCNKNNSNEAWLLIPGSDSTDQAPLVGQMTMELNQAQNDFIVQYQCNEPGIMELLVTIEVEG